jgi:hypothetical protein
MRALVLSSLLALAACGTDDTDPSGPGPVDGDPITIDTPSFTLQPGDEKFNCYYTTLPTTEAIGMGRISSHMPPGSHHMIVYKTRMPGAPDGTMRECRNFGMTADNLADFPVWLYASQEPEGLLSMPDGVAMPVGAQQHLVINMHYINQTDAPITASVHIEFEPLATKTYMAAHTFITYNTQINVPAGATGKVGGSCTVPDGSQFLSMSTHSHQYTTSAQVKDGDRLVIETRDWAHAALERWPAPYLTFASKQLSYECNYTNTTTQTLTTGESAIANEMCMAVGVYFPATKDTFCLNSQILPF